MTVDLDLLLRETAGGFRDVLHAVLDEDPARARGVLLASSVRRELVRADSDELSARPWVPAPQLCAQLQFVADVARVGDLVDDLARQVVRADDAVELTPTRRMEVAVLLDTGGRRLRQLMAGPSAPVMDPAYRGCGAALFEVTDHGGRDASSLVETCGVLAAVLLQASRHASRAA